MKKKTNIIGIIPARGGSKGVPRKNLKLLNGQPLIAYAVKASLKSHLIESTIVTTDDKEIAETAIKYGAEIPFIRPEEISGDKSTDIEFFKHAIEWYEKNEGYVPEYWVLLRPTTPLRDPSLVDEAINKIKNENEATSLVSIHEFPENPGKMFGKQNNYLHGLCPLDPRPEYFTLPRQEFAPAFIGNGYVDIVKASTIRTYESCYGPRMFGFETPDTGEIDVATDFLKVEFYLNESSIYEKIYQ